MAFLRGLFAREEKSKRKSHGGLTNALRIEHIYELAKANGEDALIVDAESMEWLLMTDDLRVDFKAIQAGGPILSTVDIPPTGRYIGTYRGMACFYKPYPPDPPLPPPAPYPPAPPWYIK